MGKIQLPNDATTNRAGAGDNTRKRLQQVALDLFWEKGYGNTTTRDVAARLGIQQASLYYHIKTKEDLLHGICYSSLRQVVDNGEAAIAAAGDPLDAIRRFTCIHLEAILRYQKEFAVALIEYRSLGAEYHATVEGLWWRHKKILFRVIDQAKESNLIRSDIPNKYIYGPMVCTLNWAGVWYRQGKGKKVAELGELYVTMFLQGAAGAGFKRCVQSQAVCRNVEFLVSPIAISEQFPVKETFATILDTACALFARKGYFATSIREIASAMGIQKASLYYYISSKEDLIFKISQSANEHLTACVNAALAQVKGPEERLYTFITAHVAGLIQHQNWHAAANEELMHAHTPERRALIVAGRDAYEQICRQILSDAQRAGIVRSDIPVKYLSLILFGMITNLYSWYQPEVDIPAIELGFTLADLFVGGISAQ